MISRKLKEHPFRATAQAKPERRDLSLKFVHEVVRISLYVILWCVSMPFVKTQSSHYLASKACPVVASAKTRT